MFWLKIPHFVTSSSAGKHPEVSLKTCSLVSQTQKENIPMFSQKYPVMSNMAGKCLNVSIQISSFDFAYKAGKCLAILLNISCFVASDSTGDCPNISLVISRFLHLSHSWKISWHLIKKYPALFSQIQLDVSSRISYYVASNTALRCSDTLLKISSLSLVIKQKKRSGFMLANVENTVSSNDHAFTIPSISQQVRRLTCMQCQHHMTHIVEMSISYVCCENNVNKSLVCSNVNWKLLL